MNTQSTEDPADLELRNLLAQADPEITTAPGDTADLLGRVQADIAAEHPGGPVTGHRPWLQRHWQGALIAAAAVAALALAAPTALPGLTGAGTDGDDTSSTVAIADGPELAAGSAATDDLAAEAPSGAAARDVETLSVPGADVVEPALVRSASLLVGTEDVAGERDAFVATILALGGRVTSETVVTEGSDSSGSLDRAAAGVAAEDYALGSPYPWYPTGPGVWLTVDVPVDEYEKAMAAARGTGEVVQMQQSSYDAGTQIADVTARVAALEASLTRLTSLLGSAENVSDVIALEQAIAQRQAQLDSLRAQQRNLANQTAMSRISLTLMSPEDARGQVDPDPEPSWWESFLDWLGELWAWLGRALLIISPLLIATAVIWWVRRRQRRRTGPEGDAA